MYSRFCNQSLDTKGQWYPNLKQWRPQCKYYSIFLYVFQTHLAALNLAYVMILGLALPRVKAQLPRSTQSVWFSQETRTITRSVRHHRTDKTLSSCCYSVAKTPLVAQTVKCLPTMWETQVWSLGQEDPLKKKMATLSSILAWKIDGQRRLAGYSL